MADSLDGFRLLRRSAIVSLIVFAMGILTACGGGSNSSVQMPPPKPSFTLSITPSAPTISPGQSTTVQVSVEPSGGFTGTVATTISGLPTGVTANPTSFSLTTTGTQSVQISTASSVADGNYPVTVSGTSGNLSSTNKVTLTVATYATFSIIPPFGIELTVFHGESTSANFGTEACCSPDLTGYSVTLTATGLPTGVTATFSPNPVTVGSGTTLTLSAASSGPWIQNAYINIVGKASVPVPNATTSMLLEVPPPPGTIPASRTDYLRTDDTPVSIVYDAARNQLFASEYNLNRVDVISTISHAILKSIAVASPRTVAFTTDKTQVLVGSDAQQITAINPSTLMSTATVLPTIGTVTYRPYGIYPLADGTVAIMYDDSSGLRGEFAIWNPTVNTVTPVTVPTKIGEICLIEESANGSTLIVSNCTSTATVALYDVSSHAFTATHSFSTGVNGIAAGPDGSRFVIFASDLGLYDATLTRVNGITVPADVSGTIFSADGSKIYCVAVDYFPLMYVLNGTTGVLLNTAPALGTTPPNRGGSPNPFVETPYGVDSTGMVFGSADHGVAFDDSTYSATYAVGVNHSPIAPILSPSFGATDATTTVDFPGGYSFASLPDVWFGVSRGSYASLLGGSELEVNAPPATTPGPVHVKVISPDATAVFDPLAFSYGPSLMFVNGDTLAPQGGATVHLLGLGIPTDPSQITVSIGGNPATVASASPTTIDNRGNPGGYPYPLIDVAVMVPPGTGDADVVLTTADGSSTLPGALHYAASVNSYASTDTLRAITLDRERNVLYISAGDHVDVFSLASAQFLAPFTPPSLSGGKDFRGLTLTPNANLLVVANHADGSVAVINPDAPASAQAVQVIPSGASYDQEPENVVASNNGSVFVDVTSNEEGCGGTVYELDLSTSAVTPITYAANICIPLEGSPIAASLDGSKIALSNNGAGNTALYDVASGTWTANLAVQQKFTGTLAISANGAVVSAGTAILDPLARMIGSLAAQDVFVIYQGLPLQQMNDAGTLLYVPYANNIDIFSTSTGALLRRIVLQATIPTVTNALAINADGTAMYVVTSGGLAIIQLPAPPSSSQVRRRSAIAH